MTVPIKWAAEVANVREVSLLASADLKYWTDFLRPENLVPVEHRGRSQILIVSAEMKFIGVRFREISFSVVVQPPDNGRFANAAFLVKAFNSFRPFAFSERVFFSTPYHHADVRISQTIPCSMQLQLQGDVVFRAEMQQASSPVREPARSGIETWEGPIYLPRKSPRSEGKLFIGRLSGDTRIYPFVSDGDITFVKPTERFPIFQALIDSRLAIDEWIVRFDATHCKSISYGRGFDR